MTHRPAACLAWLLMTTLTITAASHTVAADKTHRPPVRVFILAGQSNMEGKAQVALLERQITAPATRARFAHLHHNGTWVKRSDVHIRFLNRSGPLTVGFGSPGRIGPELDFGHTMGDHYEQPVLMIKTAWGGKSLFRDFRPPSAGLPDKDVLERDLEQARKRNPDTTLDDIRMSYGAYYRQMIGVIRETLTGIEDYVPDSDDRGYELAGLVWFQGWNDMINADSTAAYTDNMIAFIRDVRRDLKEPQLPVVIGQLGVGGKPRPGSRPNPRRDAFKMAQAAAADVSEFQGNVAVVATDTFWDLEAEAVFAKGWKEHRDEWDQVGSDYPYHYLGSARTYCDIGRAFAEAMLALQPSPSAPAAEPPMPGEVR